MTHLLVGGH
jgi:hypothetical protein